MRFAEMILIGAMLFQCGSTSVAFAKPIEQSEYGYVFSVKDTSVDLTSIGEKSAKVDYLSGNLFYSETLDAAYEFAGNNIECIAPDAPVELHEYPKPNDTYYPFQWQFEVGNMKEYYSKNITGKGVIVGIIDSGVFREHEEFTNTNILTGCKQEFPHPL